MGCPYNITVSLVQGRRGGVSPPACRSKKHTVILSVSEGSRLVTLSLLFTGFFVAALLRMTVGRKRAALCCGPYNTTGSLMQRRRDGVSPRACRIEICRHG